MANSELVLADDARALAWLLRWYAEMGVDLAVDAEPHDRFAEKELDKPRCAAASAEPAIRTPPPAPPPALSA
ncbi:MAG: hypothetical protein WAM51_05055, partial [Methylovirgula sp.]